MPKLDAEDLQYWKGGSQMPERGRRARFMPPFELRTTQLTFPWHCLPRISDHSILFGALHHKVSKPAPASGARVTSDTRAKEEPSCVIAQSCNGNCGYSCATLHGNAGLEAFHHTAMRVDDPRRSPG
jgi:hypothetical protein